MLLRERQFMQPARFRQEDILLVEINNAKSMSPAVSSGRSAGSFPEQRLVIEPKKRAARSLSFFSRRQGNGAKILSRGLFVTRLRVETRMAYRMIMMS